MTLTQLVAEYRESAKKLKNREDEIKKQIKKGLIKLNSDTQLRLKTLRQERYDAIKTAYHIETFYLHKGSGENE